MAFKGPYPTVFSGHTTGLLIVKNTATFAGGIDNVGTLSGGIAVGALPSSHNRPIAVSAFAGGIANRGRIAALFGAGIGVGGTGIGIVSVTVGTFSGGITNTGSLTIFAGNGIAVGGRASEGAAVTVSSFTGGISNKGTISAAIDAVLVGGFASSTAS